MMMDYGPRLLVLVGWISLICLKHLSGFQPTQH